MSARKRLSDTPLSWAFTLQALAGALRAAASGRPVVWLSLSGGGAGSAADLRGRSLAPELARLGWSCVVLHPRLRLNARRLLLRWFRPDVVLLQQTRHPLNRPEIYAPVPCVLDADDADIINPAERERIGDIARRCHGVVAGSRHLAGLFGPYNHARRVIWTGTHLHSPVLVQPNGRRGAVLAWAPSDPFGYPSELAFVQQIGRQLRTPGLELRIYGIPPARQAEMQALWHGSLPADLRVRLRLMPPLPYPAFLASLSEVAVGLQPVCADHPYSLGKSFGKALAYLAADTAIIASDNIDHPLFFRDRVNSRLLGNEASAWAQACDELLAQPEQRQQLVGQARHDLLARLTTARSAALLSELLHQARQGLAWPRGLAPTPNSADHD
ncbi:MAG: hypothetical protein ABW005_08450 [Burkholderiaceae bacterium]